MTLIIAAFAIIGTTGIARHASANNDASAGIKLDGRESEGEIKMQGNMERRDDDKNKDSSDDHNNGRGNDWKNTNVFIGKITAINGTTISAQSIRDGAVYTVNAGSATVWNGSNTTLAKLSVNDTIIVKGTVAGNVITATAIAGGNWKDKWPENGNWNNLKPGVIGTVTAVSGTTLTVRAMNGMTYSVETVNAKFQKDKNTAITIANIAVNDSVIIQGTVNGTSVSATNVFDVETYVQKIETKYKPDVSGKVTAVNGMQITVLATNGTTYVVDGTNAKFRTPKDEVASSQYTWSNIKVGDTVWIKGAISGTTVNATSIVDTNLAIQAAVVNKGGFFHRIGNWFRGMFGRK